MSDKKIRNFLVISQKGEHEYNIVVSEVNHYSKKYELFASNNKMWSEDTRDKLLLAMANNGNGIQFDRDMKSVAYDMGMYMWLLLSFDFKIFSLDEKSFKIIEENSIIEL